LDSSFSFSRRPWILASLWLLALPLALALPCFFGYAWAEGDLVRQFYPWKSLLQEALRHGEWPLWNPYVYCGMPFLGNFQSGVFCLNQIPFDFLSFVPALGWHLLLDFFLTGLGFYAFARAMGLRPQAALLAALAWQGNAYLLARVEFMSALSAYAWTPWLLWAVATKKPLGLMALLVGIQALCGYPLELGFGLFSCLVLAAILGEGRVPRAAGAWALGLLLGSVQILPGLELMRDSSRLHGGLAAALMGELHPDLLWAWIFPFSRQPWTAALSVALPTLCLFPWARGRAAAWAWLLLIFGLALSWGLGAGFLPNRHPSIALIYAAEGIALLAGLGAERLGERISSQLYVLAYALLLIEAILPWYLRGDLVEASLYRPSPAASFMAPHLGEQARIMLAPEVQLEVDSIGRSNTESWQRFADWLQANTSIPAGIHDANGYDPLQPRALVPFLNQISFPRFDSSSALLPLLGVGAVVTWDPQGGRFHAAIHKLPQTPLRAVLVPQSESDLLSLGANLLPSALSVTAITRLQSLARQYPVHYAEQGLNAVELQLPSTHPAGWLFVNDSYEAGWESEVDQAPVPLQRALGNFRALALPQDAKRVTLQYRPFSFRLGALLSVLAFALCLVLAFRASRGRNFRLV
jgi:hypothetical protein